MMMIYESNYSSTNGESNIFRNINNNRALKKGENARKNTMGVMKIMKIIK